MKPKEKSWEEPADRLGKKLSEEMDKGAFCLLRGSFDDNYKCSHTHMEFPSPEDVAKEEERERIIDMIDETAGNIDLKKIGEFNQGYLSALQDVINQLRDE